MNFLDGIATLFRPRPAEKATPANPVIAQAVMDPSSVTREEKLSGNMEAMLKAYRGWTYICCSLNAQTLSAVPLRLYIAKRNRGSKLNVPSRRVKRVAATEITKRAHLQRWARKSDAESLEEITEHPFLSLMDKANGQENEFDLMHRVVMYLSLTGRAFWWIKTDNLDIPNELWTVKPTKIVPLAGKSATSLITGYKYTIGTEEKKLRKEEVVYFLQPNPRSLIFGWGNVAGGSDSIDIEQLMATYEKSLFRNQARPDTAYLADESVGLEEGKRLDKRIKQMFRGANKAGRHILLGGIKEVKAIGYAPKDLAFLQGHKIIREKICAAFHVPMSMVSTENVNRANAEEGRRVHRENAIRPLCFLIEQKINEQLMPLFADNVFCAFDDPVPEDLLVKREDRAVNLKMGYTTINEERESDGLEPVEWGDVPIMPIEMVPLGSAPAQPEAPTEEPKPAKDYWDVPSDDLRLEVNGREVHRGKNYTSKAIKTESEYRATLERVEELMDAKVGTREGEELHLLASLVEAYEDKTISLPGTRRRLIEEDFASRPAEYEKLMDFLGERFRATRRGLLGEFEKNVKTADTMMTAWSAGLNDWKRVFGDKYKPLYKSIILTNGKRVFDRLPAVGVTFDVESSALTEHLDTYSVRLAGDVGDGITLALRETVAEGVSAGEVGITMRRRIEKVFGDLESWKAERIARTEVTRAHGFAAEEAMKQSGVVRAKRWLTAMPCEICAPFEGMEMPLGGSFAEGDYGFVEYPPLHPNCRCVIIEVLA